MYSRRSSLVTVILATLWLVACAGNPAQPPCPADRQNLPDCPPQDAVTDSIIEAHYQRRDRAYADTLDVDPIALGMQLDAPVNEPIELQASKTEALSP